MDAKTFEQIRTRVQNSVSEKRYAHSLRTAEMARTMCERYGLDGDKGYFAGVVHDMCKDCTDEEMLAFAAEDGMPISAVESTKPALLHGRAAAVVLQKDYGITDSDILQAVANHTLGGSNLCALAKILFAADKIEPGRPQSTDEYRARLLALPLDELVLAVVEENIAYLEAHGKAVAPLSLEFRAALRNALGKTVEQHS